MIHAQKHADTVKESQLTHSKEWQEDISLFAPTRHNTSECLEILSEFREYYSKEANLKRRGLTKYTLKVLSISQIPEDIPEEVLEEGLCDIRSIDDLTNPIQEEVNYYDNR